MYLDELKSIFFSTIHKSDPYRGSKEIGLKSWCSAFLTLFNDDSHKKRFPFFLDVLSDEKCWEKTDTIHPIKLNRRLAAKKMVQLKSWKGESNPLNDFERYQIACWCCLEEDVVALFEHFKRKYEIKVGDTAALKKLVKVLSRNHWLDPMMRYWSHIASGYASDIQVKGKHLYEQGLDISLDMYTGYVEAVEFFWNKIKSLLEKEMKTQKKAEILMKTAVRVTGIHFSRYPEIFEFCIRQIRPEMYPQLLKREFVKSHSYGSLSVLLNVLCFDVFRQLFDCLGPNDITEAMYYTLLTRLEVEEYSEYYVSEAAKLFMYMWLKIGFDKHRAAALKKEMNESQNRGLLLVPFVKKNCMQPVWTILDKATSDQIRVFMNSYESGYICSLLEKREDKTSLDKFISYKSTYKGSQNPSTSSGTKNTAKKLRSSIAQ